MNVDKISKNSTSSLISGDLMESPEVVDKILELTTKGWGKRTIATELGISSNTVTRYRRQQAWLPIKKPIRKKRLHDVNQWLEETFLQHKGNAEVVRQELIKQHGIDVHLRTVERAVKPLRQRLAAETLATIRFETPPGKQLQIDFGSMTLKIANEKQRVSFFVATLGYSRRQYVQAFSHERQTSWLEGLEGAFQHFSGVPQEVLLDNARSLVTTHNPLTHEIVFNERFRAFADYWRFKPKACAPYRARTKGKDERSVGYIKRNCIAGREFSSWEKLEAHLISWMREVSDERIHGTTRERPIDRFLHREAATLQPLNGKPPFCQIKECHRVVHTDACIEVDSNFYSVPWQLIKQSVIVQLNDQEVKILLGAKEVARHPLCIGQRQRIINPKHLSGIVGAHLLVKEQIRPESPIELLRPLAEYEAVAGGGWS